MKTERNECIQIMRGFGALTVFVWHTHTYIKNILNFQLTWIFKGFLANTFFFFLTAYFVGVTFTSNNIKVLEFVKKRVIKIYPLYCITTVFMALKEVLAGKQVICVLLSELIPHLLLIRSWIPGYKYDGALNGPGWFLSSCLLYWMLTKCFLRFIENIIKKEKGYNYLFVAIMILLIVGSALVPEYIFSQIPNAFQPEHIIVYILGLYIGCINQSIKISSKSCFNATVIALSSVIVIVTSNILDRQVSIMFFTIELFYLIPFILKRISRIKVCNVMINHFKTLGNISFEFYMLHMPTIACLGFLSKRINQVMDGSVIFVVGYILTYLSSIIYKKIILGFNNRRLKINCIKNERKIK